MVGYIKAGRFSLVLAFCLISLFLWAGDAHALMVEMSFEELAEDADSIVMGTVKSVESYWNDNETNIYTNVKISVENDLKGALGEDREISIIVKGGKVGDERQWVEDEPTFVAGETVGLFLNAMPIREFHSKGLSNVHALTTAGIPFTVHGLYQGKFAIIEDESVIAGGLSKDNFKEDVSLALEGQPVPERQLAPEVTESTSEQTITSISPNIASAGTNSQVVVRGSGFGSRGTNDNLRFFYRTDQLHVMVPGNITSWSDTEIRATVPVGTYVTNSYPRGYPGSASSGPVMIEKNGQILTDTAMPFTVTFGYMGYKWPGTSPNVTYLVNAPSQAKLTAVQAGAQLWNEAGASFRFTYGGSTTKTEPARDGENIVSWTDLPAGVLGRATNYYDGAGNIVEADFAFNTRFNWSTASPTPSDRHDVKTVGAHEMGHWLGLRDLYGNLSGYPQDTPKMMFGTLSRGTSKNLHAHDIDGLRWIYGTATEPPAPDPDPDPDPDPAPPPGPVGVSLSASPASPSQPGQRVTFTATATGMSNPEFEFYYRTPTRSWTRIQRASSINTFSYTFRSEMALEMGVRARSAGSRSIYTGRLIHRVEVPPVQSVTITPSVQSPTRPGVWVTFTANAVGGVNPEYRFYYRAVGGSWKSVTSGYHSQNWFNLRARGEVDAQVGVRVRSAGSKATYNQQEIVFHHFRWDGYGLLPKVTMEDDFEDVFEIKY